jgi:hypothetical protein
MANFHLQVNDSFVDWDNEPNQRKSIPCDGCGVETKGRADISTKTRNSGNIPYCMTCALNYGFGDNAEKKKG